MTEESRNVVMTKISRRRLQKDIVEIIKHPLTEHGIYYAHDEQNMLNGYAIIFGPSDTIYRYGAYCFQFKFPTNYPFSPPKLIYLTNDEQTRFHPNLYRNGKVCISVLNTWKGEQWTSCQTIKSILLMLVTLFHNKPLLNEPGIKETHISFIPYNKIITYKNLQIAVLRSLIKEKRHYMGPCRVFGTIYENYIKENKEDIINYVKKLKIKQSLLSDSKKELRVSVYNMKCYPDYKTLETDLKKQLEKI